jgi:hypothetical protein
MPNKDPEKRRATARAWARKAYQANPEKFRALRREAYAADPEKARQSVQTYRDNNPEKARASNNASAQKHKEKRAVTHRIWYIKNQELLSAKQAAFRKAHPEIMKERDRKQNARRKKHIQVWGVAYRARRKLMIAQMDIQTFTKYILSQRAYQRVYQQIRRTRMRELPSTFTQEQEQFMLQYWGFSCAVCGNQQGFQWFLALDHWIPVTSPDCPGTVVTNMIPLCHGIGGCNNMKRNQDGETWLKGRYESKKARKILKGIHLYFSLVRDHKLDACL